jgi:predicted ATP-grasp superfamily ATP-dependent carboligase
MRYNQREVIILGNDHTNSLGVAQALANCSFTVKAYVWGNKSGMLKSSKSVSEVQGHKDVQKCIDAIIEDYKGSKNKVAIIACCDDAALCLEKNSNRLAPQFVFEYSSIINLHDCAKKELQVELAQECGFSVPKSWKLDPNFTIPDDVVYPCLIKPLISCKGAKSDIRVCKDRDDLILNLSTLGHTKSVILQQYIDRDYEISILGCSMSNGDVYIPAVENKLTLYPKYVGLECLANVQPLEDKSLCNAVISMIRKIGYVGLFSVELMHCKNDDKFYFTEINLRNDGANSFICKYGVNLPLNHVEDLFGMEITKYNNFNPGYYIWEMHHFLSLVHRERSLKLWLSDVRKCRGFLTYYPNDKKPFFKQFSNWFLTKLKLKKASKYD